MVTDHTESLLLYATLQRAVGAACPALWLMFWRRCHTLLHPGWFHRVPEASSSQHRWVGRNKFDFKM